MIKGEMGYMKRRVFKIALAIIAITTLMMSDLIIIGKSIVLAADALDVHNNTTNVENVKYSVRYKRRKQCSI